MIDEKILIFHIGQLGDTLVSVPSLHVIKDCFPNAHITLLCDKHNEGKYVMAADVLAGSGLVDNFMHYPVSKYDKNWVSEKIKILSLIYKLRSHRFAKLVYLLPSRRNRKQVKRDIFFFRLAGIKHFIGHRGFYVLPEVKEDEQLPCVPHEADMLLSRLKSSGLNIPEPGKGNTDLNIDSSEDAFINKWLSNYPSDRGRKWIAIAPGSKMPVKVWPNERYIEVIKKLIAKYDVWPVIFGGLEDSQIAEEMASRLKRGYIAAGELNIRQAIAAMKRCKMFLGNDSGAMHLAVCAGLKCVAVFSSRDYPEKWYPYGTGHMVFRTKLPCEGCMLEECKENKMKCILSITEKEVAGACESIMEQQL